MKKTTLRGFMLATTAVLAAFFSSCNTEEVDFQTPEISVSPTTLTAPDNKLGEVSFEVTTNRAWKVVIPDDATWVAANPSSGQGNATITLSLLANNDAPREVDIKVATTTVYATLKLKQPGAFDLSQMFDLNFGAQDGTLNFADWTDRGASGVSNTPATYAGDVQFRSNFPSKDYPGASAGEAIYTSTDNSYFQINNLNVNTGQALDYYITFGSSIAPNTTWSNENLLISVSTDGGAMAPLTYQRSSLLDGWKLVTSDRFQIAAGVRTLSIKFTCKLTGMQLRIDDVKLFALGNNVSVTPFPSVVTDQYLPDNINTTSATIGGHYSYSATTPAIDEVGVAWKEATATDFAFAPAIGTANPTFTVTLTDLAESTSYTYKAYAKVGTSYYYGDPITFKTKTSYTPPTPVATYSDDFNTITTANVPYTGLGWTLYSSNALAENNWKTGLFENTATGLTEKYIQIVANKSLATDVTAYAMIPPVNVASATSKLLIYNYAYYFSTASGGVFNNSKFEVVASTDFAGNFNSATWTVIDNASKTAADPTNTWALRTVNLSTANSGAYASATKLFIAFRYMGKSDTYRLDDVFFGQATPPVIWGTPRVSKGAIFSTGAEVAAGTKIQIPYKFGVGSPNVSVAVSGAGAGTLAVAGGAQTLISDAVEHLIELPISGIPGSGAITFTINGITGLNPNTVAAIGVAETILTNTSLSGLTAPTTPSVTFGDGVVLTRVAGGTDVAPTLSYTASSSSLWCPDWQKAGAAWVISFPIASSLTGNVKLETNVWGVAKGPKAWLAQYSTDNVNWANGATPQNSYNITTIATPGDKISLTFALSGTISAGGKLYIKLYPDPNSTVSTDGTTIGTSSVNSRIASSIVLKKVE